MVWVTSGVLLSLSTRHLHPVLSPLWHGQLLMLLTFYAHHPNLRGKVLTTLLTTLPRPGEAVSSSLPISTPAFEKWKEPESQLATAGHGGLGQGTEERWVGRPRREAAGWTYSWLAMGWGEYK